MLNTVDLEQRWLKYKIKSYTPHAIIILSSSIILIVSTYLLVNTDIQTKVQTNIPSKKDIQVKTQEIQVPIKKENKEVPTQQPKLQPSLGFIKHLQTSSLAFPQEKIIPKEKVILKEKKLTHKKVLLQPPHKEHLKITIDRHDTTNNLQAIIKRFQINNNPKLSLFIAKKYYTLQNYKQAYNYALITNKINNNIEGSWLIFSKSLLKLGKRDEAISMLQSYIKSSHSSNAKLLLEEILSGKFI